MALLATLVGKTNNMACMIWKSDGTYDAESRNGRNMTADIKSRANGMILNDARSVFYMCIVCATSAQELHVFSYDRKNKIMPLHGTYSLQNRGFGGYPIVIMSLKKALNYCKWQMPMNPPVHLIHSHNHHQSIQSLTMPDRLYLRSSMCPINAIAKILGCQQSKSSQTPSMHIIIRYTSSNALGRMKSFQPRVHSFMDHPVRV